MNTLPLKADARPGIGFHQGATASGQIASGRLAPSATEVQYIHEVLSIRLGKDEFGIDITKVQEVRPYEEVGRFHDSGGLAKRYTDTAGMVKGVVKSRGVIMPVVDLRSSSNILPKHRQFPMLVVLQLAHGFMGMVVDSASHRLKLHAEYVISSPRRDAVRGCGFLIGAVEINRRKLLLLDVEALMRAN